MKKVLFILFIVFSPVIYAQEKTNISLLELQNSSIESAILNIENKTDFKFYFDKKWLEEYNTILITKKYENATVENILIDVLSSTNLNFFVDSNKIILTQNSIIYDAIPESEIVSTIVSTEIINKKTDPVFFQQFQKKSTNSITLIGKESKKNNQKNYTLTGVIINEKTNEPTPNVVIRTKSKTRNAVTNEDGFFSISLPVGLNEIEIISLNYLNNERKIMIYNNGNLDIKLTEKINELNEVVVSAKEKENVNSVTTGVTTITSEEIKSVPMVLGERDILKVATVIPGIKSVGEGASGFNVRGGKEDQNLFLLDDAVLYNPAHFFGFFSSINAYTIKSADIYKGSIPAQFGGRLSSVFDISTKNGNSEKFSGEGGVGPVTSNITFSTPVIKNKSSLLVGGRATYSGWILKTLKDDALKNSKASFYDAIVKYNHTINENNDIETTFYYSDDKFNISSDSIYGYNNSLVTLKWKHQFNDKSKFLVNVSNSQYKFNINYNNGGLNSFNYGYKINDSQLQLKFNYNYNEKHNFSYGLTSKHFKLDPGFISPRFKESLINPKQIDREKGLESAIYISDAIKVSERFTVNIGARYSYFASLGESNQNIYENELPLNEATLIETKSFSNNQIVKTYGGFEPRISGRFKINDYTSIKGSYDKTYQYLHLLSSNTTQSPLDTWKLSDINVKPQSSIQYSLGIYKNLKENLYEVSVEGYYKNLENILDYKVGAELVLNDNIETELLQG